MLILNRRTLLKGGTAMAAAGLLPKFGHAMPFAPAPGNWKQYEVKTRLEIAAPAGETQAWIPLPSFSEPDWFRPAGSTWQTNAKTAAAKKDAKYGAEFLHVQWDAGERTPMVEITSRFATRDRAVDLSKPGQVAPLSADERKLHLSATTLIPTDGIVKETADKITAGKTTDLAKAEAIYQWIVDNTFRDASVRGCGIGDIASMLKVGNLGGKCADLNALFVGLARASGLPARDVYGARVAPSAFGYKSLGAGTEVVTKAQHCRAEVFLTGFGWVPVDPADVRKVVLEEPPGKLAMNDPKVDATRKALFGSWEMNWMAYNVAHDIVLPGAKEGMLEFLMYPQAEVAGKRLDCLDPDNFRYVMTAKPVMA